MTKAGAMLDTHLQERDGLDAARLLPMAQGASMWPKARGLVTAKPVALVVDGQLQEDELRRNRLTESEVFQAVRGTGSGDLSSVAAVVLETNGKLSVIPDSKLGSGSVLEGVAGYPGRTR